MSRGSAGSPARRELAWLLLLTLGLTVPFLTQAFHIDDPTFIAIARQIARDPWHPYSFSINWLGSERPAFSVLANPPLVPAYIALARFLVGESEVGLHAAFIPIALLAAWGAWRCAGCFVRHRAMATALYLATPAFVVSAHTLMPDVALVALFSHAVASFVTGLRERRSRPVAVGAVLAGLACLTRYNGLVLIPLFGVAWWLHRAGNARRAAWIGVPVGVMALWTWHNVATYGAPHMLAAASVQGLLGGAVWRFAKAAATLSYLGGAGVFPLAVVAVVGLSPALRTGTLWSAAWAVPVALVTTWLYGQSVPATLAIGLLLVVCGVYLAGAFHLARHGTADAVRRGLGGDAAGRLLLAAWLGGVLLFNQLLLFASVRYLLPALVPAVLVLTCVLEESTDRARAWLAGSAAVTLALALGLSVGDMRLANAERTFASHLSRLSAGPDLPAGTRWFVGHWGFQYYMERAGARALDAENDALQAGDLVVLSRYADPHRVHPDLLQRLKLLRIVDVPSRWLLRTLSHQAPGFFHANTARLPPTRTPFVFLPYALSTEPLDRFYLYRVDRAPAPNGGSRSGRQGAPDPVGQQILQTVMVSSVSFPQAHGRYP